MSGGPEKLETRLDAAFKAELPRPGFEDDLWRRVARPPTTWRTRLGVFFAPANRFGYGPALGAVALVAVVGFAVLFTSQGHPRLGGGSSASSATTSTAGAADKGGPARNEAAAPVPGAQLGFGPLPRPQFNPGTAEPRSADGTTTYFGAADLTWTGAFPNLPPNLPVWRWQEPTQAEADAFAQKLGATSTAIRGRYSGPDSSFIVVVNPAKAANGRESLYALTPRGPESSAVTPPEDVARKAAADFLSQYGLTPDWSFVETVRDFSGTAGVHLTRQFPIPGFGTAAQIDSGTKLAGIDVLVRGDGSVFQASGPLPVTLEARTYKPQSGAAAVQEALSSSQAGSPKVALNKAELVYIAVADGDHGFYIPAWLFSGLFEQAGQRLEKRVLVLALAPGSYR